MILLHVIRTGNGRSSIPLIMRKTAFSIPAALGTRGTGPRKVTGELQLLNLMSVSIRWLLLINITWPRSHRLCACLRRCWRRFFDLRMLRLSLLRISLALRQGSVSSCRIAHVKRPTSASRHVLLEALSHLSLLGSLIHICLQANHAARQQEEAYLRASCGVD